MKLITVAHCFSLFALSTAVVSRSEQTLKECVRLKKCPSVWNKVEELHDPDTNNQLVIAFLRYVKYNYFCDCYANEVEPEIECPDELPEGFQKFLPKNRTTKQLLSKEQKKKELLDACGKEHNHKMLKIGNRTDPTDYPWVSLLQFENTFSGERNFLCGGVLISERHVLTAAHCVTSPSNKLISVRLGEHDTTKNDCISDESQGKSCNSVARDVEVAETIVHEDYNDGISPRIGDSAVPSDLALIKLKTKVAFSDAVRPICLPEKGEVRKYFFEVAGWSTSMAPNAKSLPQKLRSTLIKISSKKCESYPVNPDYTSRDHICAGGSLGKACIADAGGPLMAQEKKEDGITRMTVFGIGFTEMPCSLSVSSNLPGVFTKVHKYLPWIEERIFPSDSQL